jgi:hypothetical protein
MKISLFRWSDPIAPGNQEIPRHGPGACQMSLASGYWRTFQVDEGAHPEDEDQHSDDARQDGAADEEVGAGRESVLGAASAGWGTP